ncbi:jg26270 [Pararge aegeria aegeria]|uniref:Jg26270 protein n=1 Tax=Pararge aegeria aegeria TaxID=348720 RepID=A0A8S4QT28_9NEOP|nr:jg26270 [Pararge aegeria aegeria]
MSQRDICSRRTRRSNLMSHISTNDRLQTTFKFLICEKRFPSKAIRGAYIVIVWFDPQIHKEKKPFKCIACEKTFVSASARRCHVRHTHLKEPWPKKNRGPKVRASRPRHYKDVVRGIPLPQVVDQASVSVEYAP